MLKYNFENSALTDLKITFCITSNIFSSYKKDSGLNILFSQLCSLHHSMQVLLSPE